jgi:hypothetical protein
LLTRPLPFLLLLLLLFPTLGSGFTPSFENVRKALHVQLEGLSRYQVDITPIDTSDLLIRYWQDGPLWRQEWILTHSRERTSLLLAAIGRGETLNASFPEYRSIPLPFLTFWNPASRPWWDAYRINTSILTYGFLDDRPSLIIGAEYGQTKVPQLWVDNERFTPLRLLLPEFDLKWKNYQKVGNHWLPGAMVVTFPDTDPYAFTITWRGVNAAMSHDRFSRENFLTTYGLQHSLNYIPGSIRPLFDRFPQSVAP